VSFRALLLGLGAVAAVLNFTIVHELARAAGYGSAVSFLYWVILDVYALTAMGAGLVAPHASTRRWAAGSSVFSLVISGAAAGAHVFIEDGELPKQLAFVVLCLPALMLGLVLHLVAKMQRAGAVEPTPSQPVVEPVQATIEVTERVSERVSERRAVASSAIGGKQARFLTALRELPQDDDRKIVDIVRALNADIQLHPQTAARLVRESHPRNGGEL
jgi:hypothetical protein